MKAYELFRYAVLAAAYLVASLSESELKRMRTVLLFGSAARFAASEESDIDLFFDVAAPRRFQLALRAKLNKAAEQFYLTNAALAFKSQGADNELSIKVGRLEEWKELAHSIASHGIVLYSAYTAKPPGLKAYTILSWETPGKSKGALLNKFYGYTARHKRYPGLLEKANGIKLGRATVMVPARSRGAFIDALEKYKVNYSRHDVWG
ncbi:MAG: nucleotidyltransferase domain-containing protein [Candidatus Aenigmarchaeota archaeon]|nr:nucleotidyltransferase domain-containing protein [Candidatus Aenigmarchaeota archaeon]